MIGQIGYYDALLAAKAAPRFDADAKAQKARILADGGEVIDMAAMSDFVKGLKTLGVYDNALAIWDARFGIKKDGSNLVSKWYDVSGNNKDATQGTGSSQPVWGSTSGFGGGPGLTFDGVNDRMSFSNITSTNWTFIAKFFYITTASRSVIFGSASGASMCVRTDGGGVYSVGGSDSYFTMPAGAHTRVAATFLENGTSDIAKLWLNDSLTKDLTGSYPNAGSAVNGIASMYNTYSFNGIMSCLYIFDVDLSLSQIQQISAL